MSPAYFFYRMTWTEAAAYLRGLERREREAWERTRWEVWASLRPWSKGLEAGDVMRFPWEDETGDEADGAAETDVREIERIRQLAKTMEKNECEQYNSEAVDGHEGL